MTQQLTIKFPTPSSPLVENWNEDYAKGAQDAEAGKQRQDHSVGYLAGYDSIVGGGGAA